MKKTNILSIDYGTKYIGAAYWNERSGLTMPIGTFINDQYLMFNLGSTLERYAIGKVVIGYPKQHTWLQKKIDALIKQLTFIEKKLEVVKVDEEYTSVQAAETLWTHDKTLAEDTVAAMHILEYYLKEKELC